MARKGERATVWSDAVKVRCKQLLVDGLAYQAVADATGVPVGTVHGWYPGMRARPIAHLPETVERQKGQPFTSEDKIRIYAQRSYERLSVPEIARRWNSTPQAIGRLLAQGLADPALAAYVREREFELMDALLEANIDAAKALPDLPKVNFRDTAIGIKSNAEAREMIRAQATASVADPGRLTVMDLARMMREAEEKRLAEGQPVVLGRAEITG